MLGNYREKCQMRLGDDFKNVVMGMRGQMDSKFCYETRRVRE